MEQFVWKPSFELGIEKIDQEHMSLLRYLNQCCESLNRAGGIFDDLKSYAALHFSGEEALMRQHRFPGYAKHEQAHRHFENRVAQMERALAAGNARSIQLTLTFLRNWFLEHILVEDKSFANYLRIHPNEGAASMLEMQGPA